MNKIPIYRPEQCEDCRRIIGFDCPVVDKVKDIPNTWCWENTKLKEEKE